MSDFNGTLDETFDWTPVNEFKEAHGLTELTPKGWKQYRLVHGLAVKNMGGVWMVSRGLVMNDDTIVDGLLEEATQPVQKLSVVSFGGLVVSNHAPITRVEIVKNTFNIGTMREELDVFNQQLDVTDKLLDDATRLLQEKAVALEISTDEKRKRLSLLDDKILATRTQAKLLRDKVIVTTVESDNLNREFVGKQESLSEVLGEVKSLLE